MAILTNPSINHSPDRKEKEKKSAKRVELTRSHYKEKKKLQPSVVMDVRLISVIIPQHIHIVNNYVVHLT